MNDAPPPKQRRLRRSRSTRSCQPRWRAAPSRPASGAPRWTLLSIFVLSLLAGAFISFGAIFATTVTAGSIAIGPAGDGAAMTAALPYGITRLLTGLVFSVGLIMVVVGGAELFTGNTLARHGLGQPQGHDARRAAELGWSRSPETASEPSRLRRWCSCRRNTPSATAPSDWWR